MACIHRAKGDCKTCLRNKEPKRIYLYIDERKYEEDKETKDEKITRKWCKTHKSIWNKGGACLYAVWQDPVTACEPEYLAID